jgi:hypothetical protein
MIKRGGAIPRAYRAPGKVPNLTRTASRNAPRVSKILPLDKYVSINYKYTMSAGLSGVLALSACRRTPDDGTPLPAAGGFYGVTVL